MKSARGKRLKPRKWLLGLSMIAVMVAAFGMEGADNFNDILVPALLIVIFGPIVFVDLRHE